MTITNNPTPKRGGLHPIYGAFVGGGPMDTSLEQVRDNIAGVKFHGNLEVDELKSTTELDKKNFIDKVELLVNSHGFQHFFYMRAADGKMHSLLTHLHLFTLADVVAEHRARSSPHIPALDINGNETSESRRNGHSKYDAFEKLDCSLSRLAVQSIIGKVLQDDIKTRYSHYPDFLRLPGSVYYMMALEASNASVALDIDDAISKFASLSLASYPGENVKGLATEALRLIKIMEGGYCLPLKLGSDLLKKVYSTSCEHFNRWMHAKLDEVRELELTYKLKDPKLMMNDVKYATLGPIALCGFLQEKYGSLVTEKSWPALSMSLPSSNLAPVVPSGPSNDVRRCFHCQATDHLRDTCPKLGRENPRRGKRTGKNNGIPDTPLGGDGTNGGPTNGGKSTTTNTLVTRNPFPAWRYIEPVDKSSVVVVGEHSYKWCSKCKCRATGKQGYFTTHHFTHEHVDKNVSFGSGVEANHSSITSLIPLADDGLIDDDIPEDEQLIFAGPWLCSITDPDDELPNEDQLVVCTDDVVNVFDVSPSIWMAPVDDNAGAENVSCEVTSEECLGTSDIAVALPVLSGLPDAVSLLTVDTDYTRIFSTVPPLAVVDLDYTKYYPCDNLACDYVGPGGFNCHQCSTGVFNTALVACHNECNGYGFLGDSCEICGTTLWGRHLLPTSLPHQTLSDYIENDPLCIETIPRNRARVEHLFTGHDFVPYPSANWVDAPCSPVTNLVATLKPPVPALEEPSLSDDVSDFLSAVSSWDDDEHTISSMEPFPSLPSSMSHGWDSWMLPWHTLPFTMFFGLISWACRCLRSVTCFSTFWLFFGGTLVWDLLELFWISPPVMPPRRLRHRPCVFMYPRHWMVLSCFMLLHGFRSWGPLSLCFGPLSTTYGNCCCIADSVHMSPLVLWDLHRLRWGCLRTLSAEEMSCGDAMDMKFSSGFTDVAMLEETKETKVAFDPSEESKSLNFPDPEDVFFDSYESFEPLDYLNLHELFGSVIVNCLDQHMLGPLCQPSKPGLNAALSGVNFLDCLAPSRLNRFPVIFDSGASIAISGNKGDFVGPVHPPATDLRLGGMARGAKVEGIGTVQWKFPTKDGFLTLALTCYYVPDCRARLLSPQRLLNSSSEVDGAFIIKKEHALFQINNHPEMIIEYDTHSHLPVGLGCNAMQTATTLQPHVNLCVTADENQNLTPSQKLLLMWHFRFGHRNMPLVQHLLCLPVFSGDKYCAASRADIPKCAICEFAKAHTKSTAGNRQSTNPETDGAQKDGALRAGSKVSADHFESRLKGRTYNSFGKTTSDQFVGGCIFVDHMSGYIHVEHQLGFSSSETIRAKQNFEQFALGHGVLVEDYLADNGIFSKTKFLEHIRQHNQQIRYCGVNAHHKNGVAERAIRTVSELARSLLLHASVHWPDGVDGTLWPTWQLIMPLISTTRFPINMGCVLRIYLLEQAFHVTSFVIFRFGVVQFMY